MSHFSKVAAALVLALGAMSVSAPAQDEAVYLDDRSNAETLVQSLYNAVNRREYLRAWSYFDDGPERPSLEEFQAGYENTEQVRVKTGEMRPEGAAGSIYTTIPVVIEAAQMDGATTVYTGCYQTRLAQPANQGEPPFVPLLIMAAELQESTASFEESAGRCPAGGIQSQSENN